ncbi:tetratricopeptide repeat protein, partial [Bradyrhizobium acaciae]|uniref:tetratricopeptide repeat protein n=1 Tax=Bradyrhizobium acaciae TaxID=2683706 RepID=UPI003B834886|nr:lytic transglycosylase domain-containing protein [Bradyrhizobium acaciae]
MNRCLRPLACFATAAALALLPIKADAKPHHQHQAKSGHGDKKVHGAKAGSKASSKSAREASGKRRHARHGADKHKSAKAKSVPSKSAETTKASEPEKPAGPQLSGDLAMVRDAIIAARRGKTNDATDIQAKITDPVGRKLVEWYLLRHSESNAPFSRYAAFITANPDWPSITLMRKRAEARMWQERSDPATVHGFTLDQPISAKGKFALARTLLAEGDRDGATRLVREAWRSDELLDRTESDAYDAFKDLLTRDDHRARMDKRIGAKDLAGARRAAQHLGSDELAIVKACGAVRGQSSKAEDTLNDVPADARSDLGYTLCRIQFLLAKNRIDDAARVTIAAAPETMAQQDTDQWWRERRILSRKLLDQGEYQAASDVIRGAAAPDNPYYRSDMHFMRGWIALRYLDDAKTAAAHFAHIDEGQTNPTVLARAAYWRGRAAEALGNTTAMRADYQAAARYPTAYYGQLALAKLGRDGIELR